MGIVVPDQIRSFYRVTDGMELRWSWRDGDEWVGRLTIEPGTHHFGFLADGEWFLPEDTPDTVPDEWGRTNATIVIEG